MLSIFSVILRHKKLVVLVTLAGFAVSAGISLILPHRYVSVAAFLPVGVEQEIAGRRGFFSQLGAFGEAYSTFLRIRRNFVIDFLLRSRHMSELLNARFKLEDVYGVEGVDDVRTELRKRTSVDIRDEGVIVIAVEDRTPQRAKALIEAYIHGVDSLLVEFTLEHSGGRKRFFEREVARRERRIASADSALRAFLDEHGIFEIEEQARAAIRIAAKLEAQRNLVKLEREMLAMTLRKGSPELIRLDAMLAKLEGQIENVRTGEGSELFPSLKKVPDLASEYLRLFEELKLQQFTLGYVRLKLEDEAILADRDVSVIQVIDPPYLPQKREWPKRKQIVIVATFAVLFWTCFGLLVRERWGEGLVAFEASAPPGVSNGDDGGKNRGGEERSSGGGQGGSEDR